MSNLSRFGRIASECTQDLVWWTRRATRRGTNRNTPTQVVGKEKAFVEGETAKAEKEAALVAVIQKDVGEKQRCVFPRFDVVPSHQWVVSCSSLSLWKASGPSRRVRETAFMKMA